MEGRSGRGRKGKGDGLCVAGLLANQGDVCHSYCVKSAKLL
jgi:hypothetical protein